MPTISVENGLVVSASGNTLFGEVIALSGDSGSVECQLRATVTGSSRATLNAPPKNAEDCLVQSQFGLLGTIYTGGNLTLDGGSLSADLAVEFLEPGPPGTDGPIDAGLGTLRSQCTSVDAGACP